MDVRGLLLVGCLAIGAFAGPNPSSKRCDTKCIEPSGFTQDRTYLYSYQTETSTFLQQESIAFSNLTISCQVRLEILGTCDIALSLDEVAVTETDEDGLEITSPNESEFSAHLSAERLRFGMQGGIVTSVCRSPGEPVWVANFKRGILSALQRTLPSTVPGTETVAETTVTGTCPTDVTADESTIHKTKDFSKCEGRYNVYGQIPGIKLVPYAPSTEAITSSQSCQQEYNDKFVTQSVCEERHILVPISDPPTGPITTVKQTLTYESISKVVSYRANRRVGERLTIVFDHSEHMADQKTDPAAANEIISQLCDSLMGGVDTQTAQLFPALIHEMRRLESSTLASVLADAQCGDYQNTLHQLLSDALGECQSSGCVEIMVNLIKEGTVTKQERIQKWIVSLNFVENPTKEMVAHLMELADFETIQKPLFLAVSSVINKYCSINPDCEEDVEVTDAMEHFELLLGSRCRYEDKEEKRMMLIALHAIGNTGLPLRTLQKCYSSESTDIALRVAAIQAVQQMPCESEIDDALARIMEKTTQDSELRITAYKALMACPSQELLDRVDALLEDEKTNQVGAYIVSSLKSLQDSNDPLKTAQKEIVQSHEISAKFLDDPMKFSHNREWSWYNETTGYGLNGEGDVIFSTNSFIPRQVAFKGGFDAMGYAFEAFELGGRMEGLQTLIESMFRPEAEEDSTRQRRSLIRESKLENMIENFEVPEEPETDGNIYIKVFGREVMFMDAEDIKAMFEPRDPTDMLVELALLAAGKTYEISKNEMMLERQMSIPMVNGLEMKVSVNASTTQRLNATGKVDIMGMVLDPRRMEIEGTIQPSYAMDVSCLMEVDAHCARTGVHYELSAHTATSLSGKLSLENGNDVKFTLRAPEEQQELVTFSSKVEFLHQEQYHIAPSTSEMDLISETTCTGQALENAIGFQLCGASHYHQWKDGSMDSLPLSGTYEFSLYAQKVEADLTSFDVEVSYTFDEGSQEDGFHLYFGTPGTAIDRSYGWDGTFDRDDMELSATVFCPHHRSQIIASGEIEENSKDMQIRWLTAESEYAAHFSYQDDTDSYHVSIGVETPRFGTLDLEGSIINTDSRMNVDVNLHGQSRRFVTLNGDIRKIKSTKKTRYMSSLTVGGEYLNGTIESTMQIRDGVRIMDATLSGGERSIVIAGRHNSREGEGINDDFFISCGFSHSPELSFRLNGDIEATSDRCSSDFKFCYGQTTCTGDQKIMLSHTFDRSAEDQLEVTLQHPAGNTHLALTQNLHNREGMKEFSVTVTDHIPAIPETLVATRLGMTHQTTEEAMSGSYEVSLTRGQAVSSLNSTFELKDSGDVSVGMKMHLGQDFEVTGSVAYTTSGGTTHDVSALLRTPGQELGRIHFHLETGIGHGEAELGVYGVYDEEKLFLHGSGNRIENREGSVTMDVRAPFCILNDFTVSFEIDRDEPHGFESMLELTLHPTEDVYSLNIQEKRRSNKEGQGLVKVSFPTGSLALTGYAGINTGNTPDTKVGLTLAVVDEELEESVFGVEASLSNRSEGDSKKYLIRVNTTAPNHDNTLQLFLEGQQGQCLVLLQFVELGIATQVTYLASDDAFAVSFNMTGPQQQAIFALNHTSEEDMFHPHLSAHVEYFNIDLMHLDVDLVANTEETRHGKDSSVVLKVISPSKTVTVSTGITRHQTGLNYHLQLSDGAQKAFFADLGTAIGQETGGRFVTDITLAATSDYLPEVPVNTGVHLERGDEDVVFVLFFNTDKPLFHFNVTKSTTSPSPNSHEKDVTVRVKIPTSIIPSLHDFGIHILQEERMTVPNSIPIKDGSFSIFWGPADNQQLTISSASSVRETEHGALIEGSLVVAQPLRITHLLPEYAVDYSIHVMDPGFEFVVTYERENEDSSGLTITHVKQEQDGLPRFVTTVSAQLHEDKTFSLRSDVTHEEKEDIRCNFLFTMDNGDDHEEAELVLNVRNNAGDNVNCSSWMTFTHNPSGIEIHALTDVLNNEHLFYAGLEGSFNIPNLDAPLNLIFNTDLNKENMELSVHTQGPVNDIMMKSRIHDVSHDSVIGYRLETENIINGVDRPLNIELVCAVQEFAFDLTFEIDGGEHKFNLGYINESSIQASLSKGESQNAQSTLTVLNPHTLYSLTTWDPLWPNTVKEAARERIDEMKEQFEETWRHYQEIGMAIGEGFITFLERTALRNEEMLTKMQEIGEGLRDVRMDIENNFNRHRQSVKDKFGDFSEQLRENLADEYSGLGAEAAEHFLLFTQVLGAQGASMKQFFENARDVLSAYREDTFDLGAIQHIKDTLQTMREQAEGFRELNTPIYYPLRELWMRELETMSQNWELAKEEVIARWGDFVYIMSGVMYSDELEVMRDAFLMSPAYRDMIRVAINLQAVREDIFSWIEERRASRSQQRELRQQDLQAYREMKEKYDYVKKAPLFGTMDVDMSFDILSNYFESCSIDYEAKINELLEWAYEQNKGYKYLFNITEGRIELWFFTDERYDDLISMPQRDPLSKLKMIGARLSQDFPLIEDLRQFKTSLYEDGQLETAYFDQVAEPLYNTYIAGSSGVNLEDLWEWNGLINTVLYKTLGSQCISGEAALVGDQQYRTFDGTYYAFAGKCSFVLAQDFVDNSFTVAVEYGRDENVMSKSFVVISDGVTLEIRDGGVFMGRDQLEFPYDASESLTVSRDYSSIYIRSTDGFTVTYNLKYDILTVNLGIFYYGKTAGLFGNFNYEPADDFLRPTGQVVNQDVFARSWEIGRQCTSHLNKAEVCDTDPTRLTNIACGGMFLDGLGPASTGHPAVDPEPFYVACVNSVCRNRTEEQLARRCSVFQAYIDECKHKGLIWLDMPKECIQCMDPIQEVVPEEQAVASSPGYVPGYNMARQIEVQRSADIVIILEEQSCMAGHSQSLQVLMTAINRQLGNENYRNNRVGLVGFGGAGNNQKAHVLSIDGELFGPITRLSYALSQTSLDGDGVGDVWGAISLAMDYPFRAGVAKHVFLMSCSQCTEKARSVGSARIQRAMKEQGVTFTVLMEEEIVLQKEKKNENKILGYDASSVFTNKLRSVSDIDDFKGDTSLINYIEKPRNPCVNLAMATEGAVFSTNTIDTKPFQNVFSLWVVKNSQVPEMAYCSCILNKNGVPQSICQ